MTVPLWNPVAFSSSRLISKTHQRERERDYVRDEWRDDRCENGVNFQTPTRQQTANVRRFPLLQGQIVVVCRRQPVCLINNDVARGVALVCFALWDEITLSAIPKDLWPL